MQQRLTDKRRLKVDIDGGSNLEYLPFPFGGTATLVPPCLVNSLIREK